MKINFTSRGLFLNAVIFIRNNRFERDISLVPKGFEASNNQ